MDDAGQERGRLRVPTPQDDYPATMEAIAGLLDRLEATAGRVRTVGLGIPGTVSPATGLVKNANSTWLIGHPLDRDLARAAGPAGAGGQRRQLLRPVRGVRRRGRRSRWQGPAGPGYPRVVFGVIVGTGTGGGVVVDRKMLVGPNSIAGEWGHNPLPWMTAGRVPRPALLLRPARLHRDVPVGARRWPAITSGRPARR